VIVLLLRWPHAVESAWARGRIRMQQSVWKQKWRIFSHVHSVLCVHPGGHLDQETLLGNMHDYSWNFAVPKTNFEQLKAQCWICAIQH